MISVVICTYNREKFIKNCLEHLYNQTLDKASFEVIVVNNNSSDNSEEIVNKFINEHRDFNLKQIKETQQGLSFARNRGIQESLYDIICYIDDDADAIPDYLSIIQSNFQNDETKAVGGKVIAKFETKKPDWYNRFSASMFCSEHDRGNKEKHYQIGDFPFGCNMAFRSKILKDIGGFDVNLGRKGKGLLGGEEKKIFEQIHAQNLKIKYIPDAIVYHNIDDFRLTQDYMDKLSIGLGKSSVLFLPSKNKLNITRLFFKLLYKLIGGIGVGLIYLLKGNSKVLPHIVRWRWLTLKSFFKNVGV